MDDHVDRLGPDTRQSFGPWSREFLDTGRAVDVFSTVSDHETANALVQKCGWSLEEYCDWRVDAFGRLLLR